ncbi:HNH endonuclease [Virgibacillus halodenitrificans]|nr:HNH endonuclease [Virgibacillus halodenitrificans]
MSSKLNKDVFLKEIEALKRRARESNETYIDINSGELHSSIGGYPSRNHVMPTCCLAMYELMNDKDEILEAPPKGKGAKLTIRYFLK